MSKVFICYFGVCRLTVCINLALIIAKYIKEKWHVIMVLKSGTVLVHISQPFSDGMFFRTACIHSLPAKFPSKTITYIKQTFLKLLDGFGPMKCCQTNVNTHMKFEELGHTPW